jgi:hypothetical protein
VWVVLSAKWVRPGPGRKGEPESAPYLDEYHGRKSLEYACSGGHTACARLLVVHKADEQRRDGFYGVLNASVLANSFSYVEPLVQNGADVSCQTSTDWTPLMNSAREGNLTIAQYLLKHKVDINQRISGGDNANFDPLCIAMWSSFAPACNSFAFLSFNTDAKSVHIDVTITLSVRDAFIEDIDEYPGVLDLVLSERVEVDTRVGLKENGIYQEPLEQVLEYLSMNMNKD